MLLLCLLFVCDVVIVACLMLCLLLLVVFTSLGFAVWFCLGFVCIAAVFVGVVLQTDNLATPY